jgi:hypothetical protein
MAYLQSEQDRKGEVPVPTWEAEIKIRRNGRLVKWERAEGETPGAALAAVHNDLELWAQDYDLESAVEAGQ